LLCFFCLFRIGQNPDLPHFEVVIETSGLRCRSRSRIFIRAVNKRGGMVSSPFFFTGK
jgi:hypothetical protein